MCENTSKEKKKLKGHVVEGFEDTYEHNCTNRPSNQAFECCFARNVRQIRNFCMLSVSFEVLEYCRDVDVKYAESRFRATFLLLPSDTAKYPRYSADAGVFYLKR